MICVLVNLLEYWGTYFYASLASGELQYCCTYRKDQKDIPDKKTHRMLLKLAGLGVPGSWWSSLWYKDALVRSLSWTVVHSSDEADDSYQSYVRFTIHKIRPKVYLCSSCFFPLRTGLDGYFPLKKKKEGKVFSFKRNERVRAWVFLKLFRVSLVFYGN